MAPKKEKAQKLTLGEFMQDASFGGGSWADEVEETFSSGTQPLPPSDRPRPSAFGFGERSGYGDRGYGGDRGFGGERSFQRDMGPQTLPDKPPYTAHLGNLSYDATVESVSDFFTGCEVVNVRIVEDREQGRPKGFGYAEFATVDGLKQALTLDGTSFEGRTIRIRIADPPKDRQESNRDLSDWSRKGPLPDLPRSDRRGPRDFSEPRPPREGPADDGKIRDFGNWERRGPLSPLAPAMERQGSRDGGRPRSNDGDSFRNRRASPAAWGPGDRQQEGSRPPRRDFSDRPERIATAADKDMRWRDNMRPAAPAGGLSPEQSRSGSEAPPSPAAAPAHPVGRPRLHLAKRTVSDAPDVVSPALSSADPKHNPFGAARPIDTAAREREIEERRLQHLKEKKEADEKAKEERRLAKEAAAKEAAAKAEAEAEAETEAAKASSEAAEEKPKPEDAAAAGGDVPVEVPKEAAPQEQDAAAADQKVPIRTREPVKSRVPDAGSWRQPSGEQRPPRGTPTGPRRGGPGGLSRGGRAEGGRPPRSNGAPPAAVHQTSENAEPSTPTTDEDGWTTVAAPGKGRRGRPMVS